MLLRKILKITAGVVLFGIIAGYAAYQVEDFRTGPVISITSPTDGYQTEEPMLKLAGQVERIAYLSLNGRQIYTDTNGYFDEELLLTDGYNIITVAGRDAFDRQTEDHVRVILNASSSLLFSSYNQNNEQEFRGQEEQETEE